MKRVLISPCFGLLMVLLVTASTDRSYDLVFSTFFGGIDGGKGIRDMEMDSLGNIYVSGTTRSPANSMAADFFVSPQGNNGWSGRLPEPKENDGPFATVKRAQEAVRALLRTQQERQSVRVVLHAGTYYLNQPLEFGPEDSGAEGTPVVYAAAPGEKVVISGGRRLEGGQWVEVNGQNAWVVDLPEVKEDQWNFRQLFVNGERRPRTRLPKEGMYRIEALPGFDWQRQWEVFLDGTEQFVYSGTDIQPWRNLHDVEVIGVTRWITNRLPIQKVDVEKRLVTFDRPSLFALDDTTPPRPSVYWVENVFEALDTPGQWYLDRLKGRLYYLPLPGEDMKAMDLVAPRLTQVLRLVGREGTPVEHVHFEGITFSHTEWEPPADWASSLQAAIDVPGAVFFDYAGRCSLRSGAIEHVGTYGVEVSLGCFDIEISHNRMIDLGAGGVKIGHFFDVEPNERGRQRKSALPKGPRSRRITVADNEITRGGQLFQGSVGVFVGENPDNKIVYNHIYNLPWVGISVGSLQTFEPSQAVGNLVEHNHVHHLGQGVLSDIGGIYTNSISPGTCIRYNVVHDVKHRDYGGWGIYTDQGSADILIEKNLVYRCSSGPLFVSVNRNITVENNIFAFGKAYQVFRAGQMTWFQYAFRRNIVYYNQGQVLDYWDTRNRNFLYDHNIYWNASGAPLTFSGRNLEEWQAAGQDKHSIVADPLFVDPEHGDFRLQPGSPAAQISFEPWDISDVGSNLPTFAKKPQVTLAAEPVAIPQTTDFFVSPQGNDGWSGRLPEPKENDGPFATVKRAQEAVRALLKTQSEPRSVRVVLRGGTYYLDQTLEFGTEDSGTESAPVVYLGAPGEKVIVSGGRPISSAAFKPVDDPGVLTRLPEKARNKVLQVDLRSQDITDFGVMLPHGWGRGYVNSGLELFFNDQSMQLARWPNSGVVPIGKVLDPGSVPRSGDFSNRGGKFTFDYDRPARWTQADDIWLSGYFAYGYADDTMKVRYIDLAERTIVLEQAHRYGLKTGLSYHAYYALNLLEEIDEPGEWYLDRNSGMLYFWPPSDPKTANISVSLLDGPMVAMEGVSYVTLHGITFETSRGMGVYIERGSDNLIAGCTFRNLGSVAVCMGQGVASDPAGLNGYILQNGADQGIPARFVPVSRQIGDYVMALYADTTWNRQAGTRHGIVGCDIYNTGGGGIILSGGDRKTLTPGGNYVLNCHIHHYNRLDWAYRTAINIDGVGNRVAHCLIHDAPLGAIGLYGNDHAIEFNEIHDVCLQADDMAAYYFGRNPSERGNTFRHNFVHHIGPPEVGLYGTSAAFFDDGSCGGIVVGNVFYKVQNYSVRFNGGHDHVIRNNILIESRASIPSGMNNEQWQNYVRDPLQVVRLRQAVDILKPPYSSRYPELADTFEGDPNYRRSNIVHDNLSVRSGDFGAGTNDMKDNLVINEDPGFVDEAGMNFQFKPDAPVLVKMPGFRPIPFEQIGLYIDEYRTVLPVEARRNGH